MSRLFRFREETRAGIGGYDTFGEAGKGNARRGGHAHPGTKKKEKGTDKKRERQEDKKASDGRLWLCSGAAVSKTFVTPGAPCLSLLLWARELRRLVRLLGPVPVAVRINQWIDSRRRRAREGGLMCPQAQRSGRGGGQVNKASAVGSSARSTPADRVGAPRSAMNWMNG